MSVFSSLNFTFIWIFDSRSRTGQIQSLSFRIAILVMCSANLDDKYKGNFWQNIGPQCSCIFSNEENVMLTVRTKESTKGSI